MEIERLKVALRPRTNWEAADLGLRFAMRWFLPLQLVWVLTALPFFAVASMIDGLFKQILFLWWFKPIYERPVLMALSLLLFDERLTIRSLAQGFLDSRLFLYLTFYRFSWCRASNSPIDALEDLSGQKLASRNEQLYRDSDRIDFVFAAMGLLFEINIVIGFVVLINFLTQSNFNEAYTGVMAWIYMDEIDWTQKLLLICSLFVAMGVSAVVYVSVGFASYINRRTIKEAWDIELGFKRLVKRLSALLMVVMVSISVQDTLASSTDARSNAEPVTDDVLADVLSDSEFNQFDVISVPAPLREWIEERFRDTYQSPTPNYVRGGLLAKILKFLLVVLLVGVLFMFFYKLWTRFGFDLFSIQRSSQTQHEERLRETRLPRDLEQALDDHWRSGRYREAMALLYRAALAHVDARFNCDIVTSDTEGDCLSKTNDIENMAREALRSITRLWTDFAYGSRTPSEEEFNTAVSNLRSNILAS